MKLSSGQPREDGLGACPNTPHAEVVSDFEFPDFSRCSLINVPPSRLQYNRQACRYLPQGVPVESLVVVEPPSRGEPISIRFTWGSSHASTRESILDAFSRVGLFDSSKRNPFQQFFAKQEGQPALSNLLDGLKLAISKSMEFGLPENGLPKPNEPLWCLRQYIKGADALTREVSRIANKTTLEELKNLLGSGFDSGSILAGTVKHRLSSSEVVYSRLSEIVASTELSLILSGPARCALIKNSTRSMREIGVAPVEMETDIFGGYQDISIRRGVMPEPHRGYYQCILVQNMSEGADSKPIALLRMSSSSNGAKQMLQKSLREADGVRVLAGIKGGFSVNLVQECQPSVRISEVLTINDAAIVRYQRGRLSREHKKTLGYALKYLLGSISRGLRCDLEGLGK